MSFGKFTVKQIWESSSCFVIKINNAEEFNVVTKELHKIEAKWKDGSLIIGSPIFIPTSFPIYISNQGHIKTQLEIVQGNYYVVDYSELEFNLPMDITTLVMQKFNNFDDVSKEQILEHITSLQNKCNIFYYIETDGKVKSLDCKNEESKFNSLKCVGNIFKNYEEAQAEVKRRSIVSKYRDLSIASGENENPWDLEHNHFYATWNPRYSNLMITHTKALRMGAVFFPTLEDCLKALNVVGKENYKKYILGVE